MNAAAAQPRPLSLTQLIPFCDGWGHIIGTFRGEAGIFAEMVSPIQEVRQVSRTPPEKAQRPRQNVGTAHIKRICICGYFVRALGNTAFSAPLR